MFETRKLAIAVLCCIWLPCDAQYYVTTVAGSTVGNSGDGGPATSAQLAGPWGIAVDLSGSLYICDNSNHKVLRVSSSGVITTFAGTGVGSYTGDTGPATSATLSGPRGVALRNGEAYISDTDNNRVRKVSTTGTITLYAGTGSTGFAGDGSPATSARLTAPANLAFDSSGNLYIADRTNARIRKVATNGVITTVAGSGGSTWGGDNGAATSAQIFGPRSVTVDPTGVLYIADSGNNRIRRVGTNGIITTFAGSSTQGYSGDNGAATSAALNGPTGVAIDASGNVLIVDQANNVIRYVSSGIIKPLAGTTMGSLSGDGGPAEGATFNNPWGVAVDTSGIIYVSDTGNARVRALVPQTSATVAPAAFDSASGSTANIDVFMPIPAAAQLTSVSFGTIACPTLTVMNSTSVRCVGWPLTAAAAAVNGRSSSFSATWVWLGQLSMPILNPPRVALTLPPVVASVQPTVASAGQTISINGYNFQSFQSSPPTVSIGGKPCTNVTVTTFDTAISCTLPQVDVDAPVGYPRLPVVIRSFNGDVSVQPFNVTYPATLPLVNITPSVVSVITGVDTIDFVLAFNVTTSGGDLNVNLTLGLSEVRIGNVLCTSLQLQPLGKVVCLAWPIRQALLSSFGSSFSVPVSYVWRTLNVSSKTNVTVRLQPVISDLSFPAQPQHGDRLVVAGNNFQTDGPSSVQVGGMPCVRVNVTSANTQLECFLPYIPANSTGYPIMAVVVISSTGLQSSSNAWVPYPLPPVLSSLLPSRLLAHPHETPADTMVNITLSFNTSDASDRVRGLGTVFIGDFSCVSESVINNSAVQCTWPLGALLASQARPTSVTLPVAFTWRLAPVHSNVTFTVELPPVVSQIIHPLFSQAGDSITIRGSNLQAAGPSTLPIVRIGEAFQCGSVTVVVFDTELRCILPPIPTSAVGYPTFPIILEDGQGVRSQEQFSIQYPRHFSVAFAQGNGRFAAWPSSAADTPLFPLPALYLQLSGAGNLSCSLGVSAYSLSSSIHSSDAPAGCVVTGEIFSKQQIPEDLASLLASISGVGVSSASGTVCNITAVCTDSNGQMATTAERISVVVPSLRLSWRPDSEHEIVTAPIMLPSLTLLYFALLDTGLTVEPLPLQQVSCTAVLIPASIYAPASSPLSQFSEPGGPALSTATGVLRALDNMTAQVTINALSCENCVLNVEYSLLTECTYTPTNERVRAPTISVRLPDVVVQIENPGDADVLTYTPLELNVSVIATAADAPIPATSAACRLVQVNTSTVGSKLVAADWIAPLYQVSTIGLQIQAPSNTLMYMQSSCSIWGATILSNAVHLRTAALRIAPVGALPTRFFPSDASMPWPLKPDVAITVYAGQSTVVMDVLCSISSSTAKASLVAVDAAQSLVSAAPSESGVVSFVPFLVQSDFSMPNVSLTIKCTRTVGDDIVTLSFPIYTVQLSTRMCISPPNTAPAVGALPAFSFGVATTLDVAHTDDPCASGGGSILLSGSDSFPPVSCSLSYNPQTSTVQEASTVLLQHAIAVLDPQTHVAVFDAFSIMAPQDSTYGIVGTCSIGAVTIPPKLNMQITLQGCPAGMAPSGFTCSVCGGTQFSIGGSGATCLGCPSVGAVCANGIISLQPNYYRPPSQAGQALGSTTELHPCFNSEACYMNASALSDVRYGCNKGYTGPLCGVCDADQDYALFGPSCAWCGSPATIKFVLAVVIVVCLLLCARVALRPESQRTEASIALRITMSFIQATGALRVFKAGGTAAYHSVMGWTDTVSSSPLSSGLIQCALRLPFLTRYLVTLASPLIAATLVIVIFAVVAAARTVHVQRKPTMSGSDTSDQRGALCTLSVCVKPMEWVSSMSTWLQQQRHWATLLVVTFVAYMPIVSSSFRVLDCYSPPIDGVTFLRNDLTVVCHTGPHAIAFAIAIAVLVVVGIGVPALLGWKLGTAPASRYADATFRARWGFLFDGYQEPSARLDTSVNASCIIKEEMLPATKKAAGVWGNKFKRRGAHCSNGSLVWWEVVVLARKACIVMLAVLVSNPFVQSAAASLLFLAALLLQLRFSPYVKPMFNRLEVVSLSASLLTAILSTVLLQYTALTNSTDDTAVEMSDWQWAVTILLILLNLGTLILLVGTWAHLQCSRIRTVVIKRTSSIQLKPRLTPLSSRDSGVGSSAVSTRKLTLAEHSAASVDDSTVRTPGVLFTPNPLRDAVSMAPLRAEEAGDVAFAAVRSRTRRSLAATQHTNNVSSVPANVARL